MTFHTIAVADVEQSIYNLITTSQGKLTAIYPALLAVINNISAYLEALSGPTSSKLMQLFNSMSSPSFLLANDNNHDLLSSLLESMNSIVEHQYKSNGLLSDSVPSRSKSLTCEQETRSLYTPF